MLNLHSVTEVIDSATLQYAAFINLVVASASTHFISACTSTMSEIWENLRYCQLLQPLHCLCHTMKLLFMHLAVHELYKIICYVAGCFYGVPLLVPSLTLSGGDVIIGTLLIPLNHCSRDALHNHESVLSRTIRTHLPKSDKELARCRWITTMIMTVNHETSRYLQ